MKVLLIEGRETHLHDAFSRPPLADPRWVCDVVSWEAIALDRSEWPAADLVVAAVLPARVPACGPAFDVLQRLRSHPSGPPVVVVLPHDLDANIFDEYVALVDDFVQCPYRLEELKQRIARVLPVEDEAAEPLRHRLNTEYGLAHLVGTDTAFVRELARIPVAAQSDCEVLVTGETGTGKELCARAIHHLSRRHAQPFVCVDCGALPDLLFENEMFGHARGAFTDAHREHKGLVTIAERGTLFLDEVDALSLAAQAKLLRFLEDRTYKPLGTERFVRADVRIVVATNRDLERAIDEKAFRRDLFFRINVLQLRMIPLRERRGDIEALARHFVERCCIEGGCTRKVLPRACVQLLQSLDWPGNIRELYNTIRRAVVFAGAAPIVAAHLVPGRASSSSTVASLSYREARAVTISAFERHYIEDMLRKHEGNVTRAAREAGKDRRVFGRLAKRHGIDPRAFH